VASPWASPKNANTQYGLHSHIGVKVLQPLLFLLKSICHHAQKSSAFSFVSLG